MDSSPGSADDIEPLLPMEKGRYLPTFHKLEYSSYSHNSRANKRYSTQTNLKQFIDSQRLKRMELLSGLAGFKVSKDIK